MVGIEKLYGCLHGLKVNYMVWEIPVRVKPSSQMLSELIQLPRGSSVGIEFVDPKHNPIKKLKKEGLPLQDDSVANFYWREVTKFCKAKGFKVLYLDSSELYEKITRISLRAYPLRKNSHPIEGWEKENYSLETEAKYLFEVEREKGLIKRLKEEKPHVVLLGKAHADYLMFVDSDGLTFKSYAAEEPAQLTDGLKKDLRYSLGEEWFNPLRDIDPLENGFTTQPKIEPTILPQRKSIERKYKAIKERRITDQIPDFIGTWDTDIPLRGLFEMLIEKKDGTNFEGRREDTFGTAKISGELIEDQVEFTVQYDDEAVLAGGLNGRIKFRGTKVGDIFRGTYVGFDYSHTEGPFEMKEFNPQKSLY